MLTIFPCLKMPNRGSPWMLNESILSSCLSVSTLTNLMSVSSSAREAKIGDTSCDSRVDRITDNW